MVKHHVQNDLNAVCIQRADQRFQLGPLAVELDRRRITRVGRKKAHGIIAPVVEQRPAVHHAFLGQLVEFKHRHQLDRVYAERFQVGYLFHQAGEGPRVRHT